MTIRTEADIETGLRALGAIDGRLRDVAAIAGPVPLRLAPGGLAGLVGIVVAQQVSRASADAIFSRLVAEIDVGDAEAFLRAEETAFRRAGLSRPKQRTMLALAEAVAQNRLELERLEAMPAEAAIAELTAVSGIGPWTAECYLLFCTGHPDIFPAGDLALQAAVGHAFSHESRPRSRVVAEISQLWSPHRSVAARLFWAYYGAVNRRDAVPTPAANQRV